MFLLLQMLCNGFGFTSRIKLKIKIYIDILLSGKILGIPSMPVINVPFLLLYLTFKEYLGMLKCKLNIMTHKINSPSVKTSKTKK